MSAWLNVAAALALVVATADAAAGQDTLSAARELYAGAAYEDALAVLNRLRVSVVQRRRRTCDRSVSRVLSACPRASF